MTLNQKYKAYKKDGGTKSFAQFAELENVKKSHLNTIGEETHSNNLGGLEDQLLSSNSIVFEEPKTHEEIKNNMEEKSNKVFGINKTILYVSSAIILVTVGAVIYKKFYKK